MNDNELSNMLHNKFPEFLKRFLNEFAETKFYKKTLEELKEYHNLTPDSYYYYFDWEAMGLNGSKLHTDEELIEGLLNFGKFGLIPRYQHDKLKVIILDFNNKEAYLETGYAVQPWASYVLSKKREIPKYMKPLVDNLWLEYDKYIKEKERKEQTS